MKVVGITSCPSGVAHTYMAADAIESAAKELGYSVKVETQGASGIEERLSTKDIKDASLIILASAVKIADSERLKGYEDKIIDVELKEAINKSKTIIQENIK